MQTVLADGVLQLYPVKDLFPSRLRLDFFVGGGFYLAWQSNGLLPKVELTDYVIAVNDCWTPRQHRQILGLDVLAAYPRSHKGVYAEHKARFGSQEERQALLEQWIAESIQHALRDGSPGITLLYQGRDYGRVKRYALEALQKQACELVVVQ